MDEYLCQQPVLTKEGVPLYFFQGVNDLECELVDFPIYSRWKKYYYFYLLLVIFFGPTVLIAVAYGRTGFVLWKSISDAKQLTGEKSKEGEKATQESKARLQVIL